MDELSAEHARTAQDADAPLAREFLGRELGDGRGLGDEWRWEEPGIYRFVGVDDGAFELHAKQKPSVAP